MLESDRLAAVIAKIRADGIESSALVTKDFGRIERVDLDLGSTVLTVCPEMLKALKVAALALPIADLILDKLESRGLAKIRDWKNGRKDRLKAYGIPLFRNEIHLQKAVV
jgi:hypothetical protein